LASYFQCEALIIKTMPYRESDELVTFFAPNSGKKRALARGVKKVKSTLRAPLQPFCQSKLYLLEGRELDTITQATIIDFFPNLRDDFQLSLAAMYIMELLDKGLADDEPAPQIYKLVLEVLHGIASGMQVGILLRFFELNLLAQLGYRPELQHCTRCLQNTRLMAFSSAAGGMLCAACSQNNIELNYHSLSGEALGIMRLLLSGEPQACRRLKASPTALLELERAIESYWQYHLDQPLPMKSILQRFSPPSPK